MRAFAFVLLASLCAAAGCSNLRSSGIHISESQLDGRKAVVLENTLHRTVLVPEVARLPYSYVFKPTGHEHFIHPHPLSRPNTQFQYYGGVIDCIPWVSGKVDGKKLQDKGLLYTSKWTYQTGSDDVSAWFDGNTTFDYADPATGVNATLFFGKRITGFAGSSRLRTDYVIRNVGDTDARFTFSMHSRTGIAKWDAGDYFYAPGEKCYVYYGRNVPAFERRQLKPPCWTSWPMADAMELRLQKESRYVFAFLPADWCVVGDEKHRESLFFVASRINTAGVNDVMKMGIFMTNGAYVVEPCLTYSIDASPKNWTADKTVLLKAGQECRFTVNLVAYKGLSRQAIHEADAVLDECVVLEKPVATLDDTGVRLRGRLAFACSGTLIVKGQTIKRQFSVRPGLMALKTLGRLECDVDKALTLSLESSSGQSTICSVAVRKR